MQGDVAIVRDRLNAEIERAYVAVSYQVADAKTRKVFGRGEPMGIIFERFYRAFHDLVNLTCDLREMKEKNSEVTMAKSWLNDIKYNSRGSDESIYKALEPGISVYESYRKALIAQNLIELPKG